VDNATLASSPIRTFALVGPGRAGTAVALALAARGLQPVAVAGRTPEATSTVVAARDLGVGAVATSAAGRGADLVVLAPPDAAIAAVAAEVAPSVEPGALVIHLSGAATLVVLDALATARPDVERGSLHPLQSLPGGALGRDRLAGSWCAVDGPPRVERLALTLGLRPFRAGSTEGDRARYHAAACVASNHLVALLGQVERLAADAGVPFEAFLPLVRATLDNVDELGPARALTGPIARGDHDTVDRHLDALEDDEVDSYLALAREAARLAGVEPVVFERVPA
jgi:predicted short-subunit dehydrogenase-like oxidoreductase (DUF2520 family)